MAWSKDQCTKLNNAVLYFPERNNICKTHQYVIHNMYSESLAEIFNQNNSSKYNMLTLLTVRFSSSRSRMLRGRPSQSRGYWIMKGGADFSRGSFPSSPVAAVGRAQCPDSSLTLGSTHLLYMRQQIQAEKHWKLSSSQKAFGHWKWDSLVPLVKHFLHTDKVFFANLGNLPTNRKKRIYIQNRIVHNDSVSRAVDKF